MTIMQLKTLADRSRDLARMAFFSSRYKDANLYASREATEQLAIAVDSYIGEIKSMQLKRAAS